MWATAPPEEKLARRRAAKPLVDEFFAWCDLEALKVLNETPIFKAIQYARNQREALQLFLTDGRVPIDNNVSERALRRQAVGRKNWLFVGSDDGVEAKAESRGRGSSRKSGNSAGSSLRPNGKARWPNAVGRVSRSARQ